MSGFKMPGCLSAIIAMGAIALCAGEPARAATYTWAPNGNLSDSGGTWTTSTNAANWYDGSAATCWTNGDNMAGFGWGSGGTASCIVTLGSNVTAGGLAFNTQNYAIAPDAGDLYGLTLGAGGITANASAAVNAPLAISTSQTWTTASGQTLTVGGNVSGEGGLNTIGSGTLILSGIGSYTGPTTVNSGTLQLNTANGSAGELGGTPSIIVNNGGTLALNAADVLGYTGGQEALIINSGTVSNITNGGRVTIQNLLTMTGGKLTASGSGDGSGAYSFDNGAAGINATSDAAGNPAIIGATISPQNTDLVFNVTRGSALPPSDLNVTSAIVPFRGSGFGIIKDGNGIMTLGGVNTYTGATTINGGTLQFQASSNTSLTGTATSFVVSNNSSVVIQDNASVTDAGFVKLGGAMGSPGNVIQTAGCFAINGDDSANNNRALTIGEWRSETSTYTLAGGLLSVLGGGTYVGWDGSALLAISGGTADLYAISFSHSSAVLVTGAGTLTLSGSGNLEVGPGGIANPVGAA